MYLLEDGLLAFFTAAGVTGCVWVLFGGLLGLGRYTGRNVRLVLSVAGEAPAMERDLRDLLRLRSRLPTAPVVLEDCGLTADARELAEYFCQRYDGVELRDAADHKRGTKYGRVGDPGGYGT